MKYRSFICGIISLLLVGVLVAGCGGDSYDKNVQLVRNGTMDRMPGVPIGKAFDQFFDKTSWESFTSTDNETIVEFHGKSKLFDEYVSVTIQFSVHGKTFNLKYVGVGDVPMDDVTALAILDTILSEYKP